MRPEGGFGGASFAPPSPVITRGIIALCIAVQIASSFGGAALAAAMTDHAALIPARVTGQLPTLPGDVPAALTLITSLFLHAGWLHLVVNLTFLLWVGRQVEIVAGRTWFVALYIVAGIAGGLLQVAVAPHSPEQVVGASGAIAGVFGAYAMLFARRRAESRRLFGVPLAGELITALWYLATWIGLQLLTAAVFNTGSGVGFAGIGGIAIWTHIGGFAVGLIAGQMLRRRWR